jgi:hypothetical protein
VEQSKINIEEVAKNANLTVSVRPTHVFWPMLQAALDAAESVVHVVAVAFAAFTGTR